MEGWIKIHRKIEKHWIWTNPLFTRAWIYCLFRANYEDTKILNGTKLVPMEQGTFLTSIKNFSDATGLSIQQTRAFWKLLENDEIITKKTTNTATKITICKYGDYQVEQQTRNKRITNEPSQNQHSQPTKNETNTKDDNKRITNEPSQNQQQIKKERRKKKETTTTRGAAEEDEKKIIPEISKNGKITPGDFALFWEIYPGKKVDKGKCLSKWKTISGWKGEPAPTWREIKNAIHYQKKSDRWQTPKFIPHPHTWLNQRRWLDDPKEMGRGIRDDEKPHKASHGTRSDKPDFADAEVTIRKSKNDAN